MSASTTQGTIYKAFIKGCEKPIIGFTTQSLYNRGEQYRYDLNSDKGNYRLRTEWAKVAKRGYGNYDLIHIEPIENVVRNRWEDKQSWKDRGLLIELYYQNLFEEGQSLNVQKIQKVTGRIERISQCGTKKEIYFVSSLGNTLEKVIDIEPNTITILSVHRAS